MWTFGCRTTWNFSCVVCRFAFSMECCSLKALDQLINCLFFTLIYACGSALLEAGVAVLSNMVMCLSSFHIAVSVSGSTRETSSLVRTAVPLCRLFPYIEQCVCAMVGGVEGQPSLGTQAFTPRSVFSRLGQFILPV